MDCTCTGTYNENLLSDSGINFFITVEGFPLCSVCAFCWIFKSEVTAFEAMLTGNDQSFMYEGMPYGVEHEGSIDFESEPAEYLENGVYCACCHGEVRQPNEDFADNEDSGDNKQIYADFDVLYRLSTDVTSNVYEEFKDIYEA